MSHPSPLRHDVFVMVAAGALLGVAYNGMGLASRPPRGIPWVAANTELPSLEELTQADSGMVAPGGGSEAPAAGAGAPPAPATGTPPAATGVARDPGAAAGPSAPATGSRATPSAPPSGAPAPAGSAASDEAPSPAPSPGGAPAEPRRVPLPFIPASDQPIQVQVATVKRFFDARGALFLDARDPAEYEKGHIPGAIRLTNAEAQNEPERMKALPVEGRPTIVYCEGGACEASLELARFLLDSGFKKVLVYMGGFPEWEAAGHPVERGSGR